MNYDSFLLIRERDVDGCGGFADVLVRLREPLGSEQRKQLLAELMRMKSGMDCPDTDTIVHAALRSVLGDRAERTDYELMEY